MLGSYGMLKIDEVHGPRDGAVVDVAMLNIPCPFQIAGHDRREKLLEREDK